MPILTPNLTRVLPALALLAFCPAVHAQDASGASASDSSVFSSAASDSYSDASGSGGASSTFSSSKPASSSLAGTSSTALLTDLGVGLLSFGLLSGFHSGSSSHSSGANGLTPNGIPSPAAVPETSSFLSLGLLLALGLSGFVVTTRKRQSAA